MEVDKIIWDTIAQIRKDLHDLKRCQLHYFTLSITSTGAILGIAIGLEDLTYRGLTMLVPLVLLLPCWLIFFDKATSITRLVGYQRALEKELQSPPVKYTTFLKHETALGEFRKNEDSGKLKEELPKDKNRNPSPGSVLLGIRSRYWVLNSYVFCWLSFLCCVMASLFKGDTVFDWRLLFGIQLKVPESALIMIAFIIVIIITILSGRLLCQLVWGRHSYAAYTDKWRQLGIILDK